MVEFCLSLNINSLWVCFFLLFVWFCFFHLQAAFYEGILEFVKGIFSNEEVFHRKYVTLAVSIYSTAGWKTEDPFVTDGNRRSHFLRTQLNSIYFSCSVGSTAHSSTVAQTLCSVGEHGSPHRLLPQSCPWGQTVWSAHPKPWKCYRHQKQ